jgi:hypothetical protein
LQRSLQQQLVDSANLTEDGLAMKIQLVRRSDEIAKEIEFADLFPPDEVRRFALEALFGYFATDGTHCWPKAGHGSLSDFPVAPCKARIMSDDNNLLHTYDLRDMANDLKLEVIRKPPDPN